MKRDYSLNPTSRSGRPRSGLDIPMTPMIDVIFLLLVFFLATSSFQKIEQLLPSGVSNVPQAAGDSENLPAEPSDDAIEQIVVKLELLGGRLAIRLNDSPIASMGTLLERLVAIRQIRADVPVIIDPQLQVKVADAIEAYDAARRAGLSRVFFATRH